MPNDAEHCETETCVTPPKHRVYWPGKAEPLRMCGPCAEKARRVMRALGYDVAVEAIEAR